MDVADSWDRLAAWLDANTAGEGTPVTFRAPATETEIARAEAEMGLSFPPSVRRAYRVHDGLGSSDHALFGVWRLVPLETVVEQADDMAAIGEQFGHDAWDPESAIPILRRTNGDLGYVEHAPDGEETPVVLWNHETHDHAEAAPSFAAFLGDFVAAVEAGDCTVDEDSYVPVSCADAPTPWST